jgi:hypothetical protein
MIQELFGQTLNSLMQIDLPTDRFPRPDLTIFRLGLVFYNHIVEMDDSTGETGLA